MALADAGRERIYISYRLEVVERTDEAIPEFDIFFGDIRNLSVAAYGRIFVFRHYCSTEFHPSFLIPAPEYTSPALTSPRVSMSSIITY